MNQPRSFRLLTSLEMIEAHRLNNQRTIPPPTPSLPTPHPSGLTRKLQIPTNQLADQWLLSAMGILTGRPHLLRSLFLPTGQEDMGRYCVRIFKEADWTNVFVDTRLPCDWADNVSFHYEKYCSWHHEWRSLNTGSAVGREGERGGGGEIGPTSR